MGGTWFYSRVGDKMNPRFHLFVSDVNQGNEGVGWVQDFLAWLQGWKDSP